MPKVYVKFDNMQDAKKAVDTLKEMGYKNAHLDIVDSFWEEYSKEIAFTGTQTSPCLSSIVSRSSDHLLNIGKASLIAANPMINGIGTYNELSDKVRTRLGVSVDEVNKNEVFNLLKELGGEI